MKTCKTCGKKITRARKDQCALCYQRDYNEEYERKKKTKFYGDPNGTGKLIFYDGAFHIGQFKDGKRHGKGMFYFADGLGHEGVWKNGILDEHRRINK